MGKNYKSKKGFSLIETLIAVSILMIAIAGPLSLVQAGLFSSIHQRNQITATYLAQEAFEFIKNVRDANAYTYYRDIKNGTSNAKAWLDGPDASSESLLTTCTGSFGCYIDPRGEIPPGLFIKAGSSPLLNLKTSVPDGIKTYGYATGGTQTIYKRTVFIENVVIDQEVKVTVKVEWNDNALSRSYVVSENIYNYVQP